MGTGGKLRRTWPQRLLLGFNAVLVLACLAAAGGLYTFEEKLAAVETVSIDSPTAEAVDVGAPRNVLIVGTDSAANLDEDDPVTNGREDERLADVIMVMRIDPTEGTARLLSFPRDSRVSLSPGGGTGRINGAIAGVDGARDLINTIKTNFGIPIDNYVEIDFAGFKDLVDTLGGVPVYFAAPVRDKNTGLYIEDPGCVVLDPSQSLAYARARHFQYQDSNGKWRFDQTGDLGRITRQQDFIKRAMQRASEAGLRNPGTAIGIVDAAADAVVMDQTLTVGTILDLVDVFRTFNPDDLDTTQVPTFAAPSGGVAYQEIDWDEALPLLLPYWGYDENGYLAPQDIIVDVEGSRAQSDSTGIIADGLDGIGFDAESVIARNTATETTITYGDAGFEAALTLATYLVDTPRFEHDEDIVGPRLELSVPRDFGGIRDTPLAVEDLPPGLRTPPRSLRETAPAESDKDQPAQDDEANGESDSQAPSDGASGDDDPGSTTLPVDEDPAFIQAAEADGAPPGIVPTDPVQAAACR